MFPGHHKLPAPPFRHAKTSADTERSAARQARPGQEQESEGCNDYNSSSTKSHPLHLPPTAIYARRWIVKVASVHIYVKYLFTPYSQAFISISVLIVFYCILHILQPKMTQNNSIERPSHALQEKILHLLKLTPIEKPDTSRY